MVDYLGKCTKSGLTGRFSFHIGVCSLDVLPKYWYSAILCSDGISLSAKRSPAAKRFERSFDGCSRCSF